MTTTNDPDQTGGKTGPSPEQEPDRLREQRQADETWEQAERERRAAELKRRVKEHWRNPRL